METCVKMGHGNYQSEGQECVFPPFDPWSQKKAPSNMQRWLVYRASKRAGFQKAACLGLKCIFLHALSSKQAWNCQQNSKALWFHLIFTPSPLRFERFNSKAVNLGRFTQNLVEGYLKELQIPRGVRELWLSLVLERNGAWGQGLFQDFQSCWGKFFSELCCY